MECLLSLDYARKDQAARSIGPPSQAALLLKRDRLTGSKAGVASMNACSTSSGNYQLTLIRSVFSMYSRLMRALSLGGR
jgi:hypothetical protein